MGAGLSQSCPCLLFLEYSERQDLMNNRPRRDDRSPLATYLFVGAMLGTICGGLFNLWLYDNATSLFHGAGIGLVVGAIVAAMLSMERR
jgi:hypothetical protein